ncbi:MAG: hypothetical protein U1E27_00435, partial [Kiritimatiellia bacterium]|nr:hypothetical protein [Kiritimatiellia bacterium]
MYTNFVEYATPQSLYLRAYMDVNENSHLDAWEPQWIGETVSAIVGSSWNLDIVLSDVPSVWGTITYSNAVGQTLRVLATLSNNWNAVAITDVEGTTNGVSEYLLMGVPPGEPVWIRAFVDANTNGLYSPGESAGYYPATLAVSNRVTEANIVLDQDTDLDGLPDWWEHMYFGGPTNAVASVDTDNDGLTAAEEFALGTHPENPDTDGDGLEDGAEVNTHGTNPLNPDTDGDGVSDDQEIMDGTDPNDAEDFWASLSGTIVYTGDQTGPIYVDVYRDGTNFVERITVGTNGLFTTTNLHGRASVTLRAFLDDNANGVMDEAAEAFGAFVMPFFIHIGEIIRLELEHEDRDGDGIPNYRDANPTQFDDRDGDRVGDGYDPEPDDPNTWVTLSVTQPLPSGAGVFSMDPQLPTNAVISKVEMYYTINAGPTGTINGKNLAEIVIPEPGGCMGEDEFGECIPGSSNGDIGYDLTPAFPNRKIGTCMIVVSEPDDLSEATITWTYKVILKV